MSEITPLPHSESAELATLGSMLIDPTAITAVSSIVNADDFHILKHGWIYEAIQHAGESADLLTVSENLRSQATRTGNRLDECGGEPYIAQLAEFVPTALNVEAYAREVAGYAQRRRLIATLQVAARAAFDQTRPVADVVGDAAESLMRLAVSGTNERAVRSISECVAAYSEQFEAGVTNNGVLPGIPLGIRDIDTVFGGFRPGRLYTIAARTGAGKSALMQQAAIGAARHGKRVLIFSLEMSGEEVVQRLAAMISAVNQHPSQLSNLTDEQISRTYHALESLSKQRIYLFDDAVLTPARLLAECERVRVRHGLDMVIVDYAQLLSADQKVRADNRVGELSYITRMLKATARRLNVPVIAGAQLNREGALGKPSLTNIRESDTLSHDSDGAILLYGMDENEPNHVEACIAKNRDGEAGRVVQLYFDRPITRFAARETMK